MSDADLIATALVHARSVFRLPHLVYEPALVFQDIRGFDSVQAVQFILAIEAAFDITLSEDEVDNMRTMGDLIATLRAKIPANSPAKTAAADTGDAAGDAAGAAPA